MMKYEIRFIASTILSFLIPSFAASADFPSLSGGTGSGTAGSVIALPVTYNEGLNGVSALEFVVDMPAGWTLVGAAAGPAAVAANKSVSFYSPTRKVIVFGLNQTVILSGVVVNLSILVPAASAAGTYPIGLSGEIYSSPAGAYVPNALSTEGSITVTATPNLSPTIASPASALPNPVTGTTAVLSVLGADDGGEAALSYTWSIPSDVTLSANGTNGAKSTTATFTRAGSYAFGVTVRDGVGQTITSNVTVVVNQTLTTIQVTPPSASVAVGQTRLFAASGFDQFAQAMSAAPVFTWSVTGGGSISSAGLFTAGTTPGGPFTVRASAAGRNGTSSLTVTASAPHPPPTQAPPVPNLREIDGKTFPLDSVIGITYTATITELEWSFVKRGEIGSAPARALGAPTGTTRTPGTSVGLSPLNLDPGVYAVSVRAWNDPLVSDWGSATVTLTPGNLDGVIVYPNPWKSDRHAGRDIAFGELPADSTVKIFTVSGHLVRELSSSTWNRRTDGGDEVASGVYVYVIESNGEKKRGKLAIVR